MTLEEGKIVAEHYQLKKQLGHGSFGDVWLVQNLLADIEVAIKFYGTFDEKGLAEFRNEFKLAYKLHHPNLLNISHFDVYENCPYLVMPYCENGSASRYIGQMPESEVWKFVLDVASGLAFLHGQQPPIVHQDIKPDNILITSDGRYVISDFGISRSFKTQMSKTINNMNSSGTIAYMGPERFSEKPMVVFASDIWAFGMTLYELITGNVLWEGMGGCVQLNGARIPNIVHTSPDLSRLVVACLAAETWNRPTAVQIVDYATAHMKGQPLPSLGGIDEMSQPKVQPAPAAQSLQTEPYQPQPKVYKSEPQPVHRSYKPQPSPSDSGSPMTKRIAIIAAAVIGVIVIIGGILFFSNSISEEQDFISCKTRQDFERFIQEHPSSSYVKAAQKRIEALTPQPIQPITETTPIATTPEPVAPEVQQPQQPVKIQTITVSQPSKSSKNNRSAVPQPNNAPQQQPTNTNAVPDDQFFYSCQTLNDFISYTNLYPNGRHRQEAQQAIQRLRSGGRNDAIVNGVPTERRMRRRTY